MSRADDLSRLREEMQARQRDRAEFVTNLARSGAEMKRANQAENKERRRNLLETLLAHEGSRRQEAWRLQNTRAEFVTNLARSGAEMKRANQAENKQRRRNVMGTLAANEGSRKRVAQENQAARVEFVTNLKQTVAGLRKENMATNAAAHAAWYGARAGEAVSAKRGGKWFGRAE